MQSNTRQAKLTKRVVDAAPPAPVKPNGSPSDYILWDRDVKGFGLRVWSSGRKAYIFRYQLGGRQGTSQKLTIATHGTLTPDQAREQALRWRGDVASGRDPANERKAARAAVRAAREGDTVADLAKRFIEDRRAKRKESTLVEYERLVARVINPKLGAVKAADLTRDQVARFHHSLRSRPIVGNRALAVISAMFRFAEVRGLGAPNQNPTLGVERYPEHSRERMLSDQDYAALGDALRRAEREGLPVPEKLRGRSRGMSNKRRASLTGRKRRPYRRTAPPPAVSPANPFAVAALRFALLTGWRIGEVVSLKWEYVNNALGLAVLPDSKTGRTNRYLGAPALELIDSLPRVKNNPYVFVGTKQGHIRAPKRLWECVRTAAELPTLRVHDLRHGAASVGAISGFSLSVIGALLGHTDLKTTQKYAHLSADPLRRAADDVAGQIAAALGRVDSDSQRPTAVRISSRGPSK